MKIFSLLQKLKKNQNPVVESGENIRLPLSLISGESRMPGRPLKFLYAGHSRFNLNMWSDALFESFEEQIHEPILLSELHPKTLHQKFPDCDLLLVEKTLLVDQHNFKMPHFEIPNWIQTYIHTSKPVKELCKSSKAGFKNARRLISKNRITCEKACSEADHRHFYEHMYLPYLRKNHGRYARELPFEDIFTDLFPVQLYHIRMNGLLVAGAVAFFRETEASFAFLGILDGNEEWVKKGVITAMYYFLADDFHKRDVDKMYIGGSPPFLNHPLTRHKIRFSADHDENHRYSNREITDLFILNQRLASETLSLLSSLVFLDDNEPRSLLCPDNNFLADPAAFGKILGLPGRLGIRGNVFLKPAPQSMPNEWIERIQEAGFKIMSAKIFLNAHKR